MKNIKYYLAAALAFSLTLPGCGEKEPVAPGRPDEPDTSVQATLSVSGEGLSEDGSTFFVGASEAASYLNVESNYADWTVKVTDGSTWLKAFSNTTTTGDRARFEVTENAELESRSATVMLSAGEGSKKIEKSVVVKQWGVAPAIDFAPESPVYAAKEGETISVTVGSNVPFADITCDFDEDWITDVTPPQTRAAERTTRVYKFEVAPYGEIPERSATIRFSADVEAQGEPFGPFEFVITQLGYAPGIAIDGDPESLTATYDQTSASISVTANIAYNVSIEKVNDTDPEPTWLQRVPQSRAFETKTINFTLTSNAGTLVARSAVIVITPTDEEYAEQTKRLTITQTGQATLSFVSQTPDPLSLEADTSDFSIVVATNVPVDNTALTVTVPSFVTAGTVEDDTPVAGQRTFNFSTIDNPGAVRDGDIVIAGPELGLTAITKNVTQAARKVQIMATGASAVSGNLGSAKPAVYIDGKTDLSTDTNYNTAFVETVFDFTFANAPSIDEVALFPRSTSVTHLGQLPKVVKFQYFTVDAPDTAVDIPQEFYVNNVGVNMTDGVTLKFPVPATNVAKLRFIASDTYATFICLSEVKFFMSNGQNYNYMSVVNQENFAALKAIPKIGGDYTFTVTANIPDTDYTVTVPAGFTATQGASTAETYPARHTTTWTVSASAVDKGIGHGGKVEFKSNDGKYLFIFPVIQLGDYFTGGAPNGTITATSMAMNADNQLVSSVASESNISYLFDGVITTDPAQGVFSAEYRSPMAAISATNPLILEFTFTDEPSSVSVVRYIPRANGNGDWCQFNIFVKPRGGEYPATANFTKGNYRLSMPSEFMFTPVNNPESVKIEIIRACETNSSQAINFPSAREIQFFQ